MDATPQPTIDELKDRLPSAAVAFRGYNVTNLGRSSDLLDHPRFGALVEPLLREASEVAADVLNRPVDLAARIRAERETSLEDYAEAIALIVAMELAQVRILEECFDLSLRSARVMMGYSLGEVTALIAAGTMDMAPALTVPLTLADDCVELARDVSLAVLFSRDEELPLDVLRRMCIEVNQEGRGVVGISAYLSPNSCLLMGQKKTLPRLGKKLREEFGRSIHLRNNPHRWPPLHTPIVWERNIPNRSGMLMHAMPGGLQAPNPPVLSLVTGRASYNDFNAREILQRWTDHPQRLWEVVDQTLQMGIDTIIHVGPEPNIIPATYTRLHDNVEAQTKGSIGMRALSAVVQRPWLASLLPRRTALLRATRVSQVILDEWLPAM